MNKKTFHKKWYFLLVQMIFWSSLIFLILLSIWAVFYEDDMPFIGVIWIIAFILIYWLVKRIFYYVMFEDRFLPLKNRKR
ncbi:MAG: hypothetical protein AABX83_00410 [Nanoarchaeota archaeon]